MRHLTTLLLLATLFSVSQASAARAPISSLGQLAAATLDESDRNSLQNESPLTLKKIDSGQQLSVNDVKKMHSAGLSDEAMIGQIKATRSVFYLSSADIVDLKKSGVSQHVINHMVHTGNQ